MLSTRPAGGATGCPRSIISVSDRAHCGPGGRERPVRTYPSRTAVNSVPHKTGRGLISSSFRAQASARPPRGARVVPQPAGATAPGCRGATALCRRRHAVLGPLDRPDNPADPPDILLGHFPEEDHGRDIGNVSGCSRSRDELERSIDVRNGSAPIIFRRLPASTLRDAGATCRIGTILTRCWPSPGRQRSAVLDALHRQSIWAPTAPAVDCGGSVPEGRLEASEAARCVRSGQTRPQLPLGASERGFGGDPNEGGSTGCSAERFLHKLRAFTRIRPCSTRRVVAGGVAIWLRRSLYILPRTVCRRVCRHRLIRRGGVSVPRH